MASDVSFCLSTQALLSWPLPRSRPPSLGLKAVPTLLSLWRLHFSVPETLPPFTCTHSPEAMLLEPWGEPGSLFARVCTAWKPGHQGGEEG